jgi:subtilisin-like proprotein convertase family protein
VVSNLVVPDGAAIVDIDVVSLDIAHSYVSDLTISLTSPASTTVVLVDQTCSDGDDMLIQFDDEAAAAPSTWPCPPVDNGVYQPENPLSAFDGQAAAGTWQLTIDDAFNLDGGSLDAWALRVCTSAPAGPEIFRDRFEAPALP